MVPRLRFLTGAALLALVGLPLAETGRAQTLPAFPGAEGYGAYAKGGRGGDVYHVTNLSASGAGSFVDAINTVPAAGRTIVFDVSGYIRFPSGSGGLRMTASKVTIAGQTAPGDGIGFYNNAFRISGDDVILRHLRFRLGKGGTGGDCIDLDSGSINSILDHVSMQFSTDENMSSYGSAPENLTLQYSLNAWGLESHSCGGLWDQNHASAHHNLWAHNHTRNPKSRPSGLLEWINNVTFDWDIGFIMGDTYTPSTFKANVRGNYFVCPPGNTKTYALEKGWLDSGSTRKPTFSIFLDGNFMDRDGDGLLNGSAISYERVQGSEFDPAEAVPAYGTTNDVPRYYKNATPFAGSAAGIAIDPALLAYKKIVSSAGALRLDADPTRPLRDEVDTVLVNNLVTQHAHHITRESALIAAPYNVTGAGFGTLNSTAAPVDTDRDGMPDYWETALNGQNGMAFNVGVDDHNTVFTAAQLANTFFPTGTPTGYTYLEEYLHWLAIPHATVAKYASGDPVTFVDVDLRKYTSGFAAGASYSVTGPAPAVGTAVLQADGHTVRFTPTAGYVGRARFNFTVDDGQSSWPQTCGILVSSSGLPRDLVWRGDGQSNAWDATSSFWIKPDGTFTSFNSGDTALFDDRGAVSPPITLSGPQAPSSVTVDTAVPNTQTTAGYTFNGAGSITGTTGLVKSGVGALNVNTTNTFAGGTIINEGTLYASRVDSLGSGKVTLAGGALAFSNAANLTVPNAFVVNAPGVLTTSNNTTFSGAFTGNGDLNVATTLLTPTATWAGYTGKLTLTNSGTLRFNQGGNPWGAANASFDAGPSGTIRNRSISATQTITLGALTGGANSFLAGSDQTGNGAGVDAYLIGGLGRDTTFAGAIQNGGLHTTALTKTGSGTLTLSGTSSYTGATTVSAGALLVAGTLGNTPVTVASGALLGGGGTLNGTVTAGAGAFVSPGTAPFTAATMNVGSTLTLQNGVTLYFDMSSVPTSNGGINDRIVLNDPNAVGTRTLALAGQVNFQFLLLDGTLSAGTYELISGATNLTASGVTLAHNLPAGSRQTFALSRASAGAVAAPYSNVRLVVTGSPAILTWTAASGAPWDYNNAASFSGAADQKFFTNDTVTFDDTAAGGTVALSGPVQPRVAMVNNSAAKPYTFAGTGSLGGNASLVKSGTGTLTIAPALVTLSSTTTSASTTVTVADASGLAVGMTVGGAGIPAGTTIIAISGTTLTLSQNATASGTPTLSYYAAYIYAGGTEINAGSTIILGNPAANVTGLGTGPVTLKGGTLSMANSTNFPPAGISDVSPWSLVVPAGQTGRLNADSRSTLAGSVSGGGTFNYFTPFSRTDVTGDWSAFTGQVNVLTDADGGDFRIAANYAWPGLPAGAISLADRVSLYVSGILSAGAGTTIEIGELAGTSLARLLGGPTGGRNLTYRIGGRTPAGSEAIFAGTILEQNVDSNTTSYVKTGAGVWRLAGACTYNGSTTVEQGTLRVAGTLESRGPTFQVQDNATLDLVNGTVTTGDLEIAATGRLTGNGTIVGDLTNNGAITSTAGTLTVTGEVVNNGTIRLTGGAKLNAPGLFTNNGVLDLLTAGSDLPANLVNNGLVIDSRSLKVQNASRVGNVFTATVPSHSGHAYQLQRADDLTSQPTWQSIGNAQAGTTQSNGLPTTLTLTDPAASTGKGFYRVLVTP